MAIVLKANENTSARLRVGSSGNAALDLGESTVIYANDYNRLINHPYINGVELIGDMELGTLNLYSKDEIEALLSEKASFADLPDLEGYASKDYVESCILDIDLGVTSFNGMTGDVVVDIPDKTSDLQNDSGFATETYVNTAISGVRIPTKTSELQNDSGFLTLATLPIYDGSVTP